MRDLRPDDQVCMAEDHLCIIDGHGSCIPLCWKDTKDWARWWLRQAELNTTVAVPPDARNLFREILDA